jgi:large subunit ribosomal protein L10
MDNPRAEKVAVVDEVRGKLSDANAAVLTEYRGLDVHAISELRRALRSAGGEYKIYKNTLVRFAARELGLDIDAMLTGPTAIAFVTGDAAAVAKALRDYAKANPNLVVKGGLLGDRLIDATEVTALADLPSRDVLLSQIAGLFAAPMQQFASLLDAVPRSFSYALQALIDSKPAEAAPAPEPEVPAAEAAPTADEAPAAAEAEAPETTETTEEEVAPAAEDAAADAPTEES